MTLDSLHDGDFDGWKMDGDWELTSAMSEAIDQALEKLADALSADPNHLMFDLKNWEGDLDGNECIGYKLGKVKGRCLMLYSTRLVLDRFTTKHQWCVDEVDADSWTDPSSDSDSDSDS
jgi:hypothetical protein